MPPFDAGTVMAARAAADLTRAGQLVTVAGAFLEWLECKELPGVAALG